MSEIIIPDSLHIVCDDLGWFSGSDDRASGGPSRTGMPRRHVHSDYLAVNELGKRIGVKINCALVLGEWDPDNRLRKIPHLSKYGEGWDNARHLDRQQAALCAMAINDCDHIDVALHGLLHGNYRACDNSDLSDYYYTVDTRLFMVEEEEIRARIEAFFDLLSYYGIHKSVTSFVPPSFRTRRGELSKILKDYGILYSSTIFKNMECGGEKPVSVDVDNGIITLDRNNNPIKWNEVGSVPNGLPTVTGIFGMHWPNLLNVEPTERPDNLDLWAEYFERCKDKYGIIMPGDIAASATHSLYKRFSTVKSEGGKTVVDVSAVPKPSGNLGYFFVSSRSPITRVLGGAFELCDERSQFCNYRIIPRDSTVTIE